MNPTLLAKTRRNTDAVLHNKKGPCHVGRIHACNPTPLNSHLYSRLSTLLLCADTLVLRCSKFVSFAVSCQALQDIDGMAPSPNGTLTKQFQQP